MVQSLLEYKGVIVRIHGRMDTPTCMAAEEGILNKVRQAGGPVAFDLAGVPYVCSMFLRICLKAAQHLGPLNLSIINVSPEVKKVFKMAGFDQQIRIE